jgi:hypothetical protein
MILLRVGIRESVFKPRAAELHDKPVLFSWIESDREARLWLESLVHLAAKLGVLGRRNPAGSPVDDEAVFQGGIISPGHQVIFPDLDPRTQRLQDAAAELVAERVIAEKS